VLGLGGKIMDYSDLQSWDLLNRRDLPIKIDTIEELLDDKYGSFICVNNKVPIRIIDVSSIYNKDNPVDLLDEAGNNLGNIFLFKQSELQDINSFNEWKFIAYLDEVEKHLFMAEDFDFQFDYLLLNKECLQVYFEKYYVTAPSWGGFSHKENSFSQPYTRNQDKIVAISDLEYPTRFHAENSIRILMQPFPFERFLKTYHQLELLFDHSLVKRIQSLDEDLKGIGLLLKSYNSSEINRLVSVMTENCLDIDKICDYLNKVDLYRDTAKKIFFDYGKKDSDPLDSDYDLLEKLLLESGGFNEVNCKKVIGNKANNREKFVRLVIHLSAYWIYRIRCSIAHSKIGEYILDQTEEEFIAEFAEPLLNEVVIQVLKRKTT
jgi:hypothetical protein